MKYFISTDFSGAGNGPGYLAKYIYQNGIIPCIGYDVLNEKGNIRVRNIFRKYFGYFGVSIDLWLTLRKVLDTRPKLIFNSSPLIWVFLLVYKSENQFLLINDYTAITSEFSLSNRYKFRQWVIGTIEKLAAYKSVNLIYNSHYTKVVFESSTVAKGITRVIYKGLDFRRYPLLQKELHNNKINLLYIKSDILIGNLEVILAFLENEKDRCHLHIVGPSLNEVKHILAGRVLPVTIYGRLNTEEIVELCRNTIDIAVIISSKEALGLALIEMVCMGVPVISSNIGGMKEVTNDGVYTTNLNEVNKKELRNVFDEIQQKGLRLDLKEGARYVRNKFSIIQTLDEYLQL